MKSNSNSKTNGILNFLGILFVGFLAFLYAGSISVYPLVVRDIFGVVRHEEVCSQYIIKVDHSFKTESIESSFFVFRDGISVRCQTGYLSKMGLSDDELSALNGTKCTVLYADFPFFDGSYPFFGISKGTDVLVSEEAMIESYREQSKKAYIVLGIFVLIGSIHLIPEKRNKRKKKSKTD